MILNHIKVSSGKKYSYRTWSADEVANYLPTSDSLTIAHYISQTRIGGFIKQTTNYEVILLLPPKQITTPDLVEALQQIKRTDIYQVIVICFNYAADIASCSSSKKYWNELFDNVAICAGCGFVDTTPIHRSIGASDSLWMVLDNEGAEELLQMHNLKHQLEYLVKSTNYSVQKLPEALSSSEKSTYKGAVR